MTGSQKHQNRSEHKISRCWEREKAQADQASQDSYRKAAVKPSSKEGVKDVSSIHLSKGKQVQTCCEQPKPGCPADWMKVDRRRVAVKETPNGDFEEQGLAVLDHEPGFFREVERGRE